MSSLAAAASMFLVSWVIWALQAYAYPVAHIEALERMEAGEALPPDHHERPEPAADPAPPAVAISCNDIEALQRLHRAIIATSPLAPHVDMLQSQMHVESRYRCHAVSPGRGRRNRAVHADDVARPARGGRTAGHQGCLP